MINFFHRNKQAGWLVGVIAIALWCGADAAGQNTFTVPYVTGRPGSQPFAGHPGWVDAYHAGNGEGISARIGDDARFSLPKPKKDKPLCLMVMFDEIETPPIIVPNFPVDNKQDVPIPVVYACIPPGYPGVWDRDYMTRATDFWQTFVPTCTQIYGVSVFDGPKIVKWGNKLNIGIHEDGPKGQAMEAPANDGSPLSDHFSAGHSDHKLPRVAWRHGEMSVEPGKTYALRASGYRSHGNERFKLDAFVRPDTGDGYKQGEAFADGKPTGGDLCCMIFGNNTGQIVENQIRCEEWEIFIPHHRPTRNWGQSFVAHGTSLAGISFWAATDDDPKPVKCEIRIRPDGAWESPIGPNKIAVAHKSPERPIIRYADAPKPVPGFESYYELPSDLFQVAYLPDEVPLTPGKPYYIEVVATRPLMMYADGDPNLHGYAFYEGLKVDRVAAGGRMTKHSERWTLAMNIVTYAQTGGEPPVP